ncbi:MAG: hypothetical protein NTY19_15375 [Planctomycetota bacterium]|nr:hypothetical protein [Planctomycetota bacterium]
MRRTSGLRTWPVLLPMLALFIGSLLAPREWAQVTMIPIAKLVGSKDRGRMIGARLERTSPGSVDPRPETTAGPALASVSPDQTGSDTLTTSRPAPDTAPPTRPDTQQTEDQVQVATLDSPQVAKVDESQVAEVRGTAGRNTFQELLLSAQDVCPLISPQGDAVEIGLPPSEALGALEQYAQPKRVVEVAPPVAKQVYPPAPLSANVALSAPDELGASASTSRDPSRLPSEVTLPNAWENAQNLDRQVLNARTDVVTHWPYPVEIARRLETLAAREPCAKCCADIVDQLRQLQGLDALASPTVTTCLQRLRDLAKQAAEYGATVEDLNDRAELQRVAHGLTRRLAIWSQVTAIASQSAEPVASGVRDARQLTAVLATVEKKLQASDNARKWREYLLLGEAQKCLSQDHPFNTQEYRVLLKRILLRIDFASLTPQEEAFLQQPELAALTTELRHLVMEPISYFTLLDELERYESELEPKHALQAATAQQMLRWSENPAVVELGQKLDAHYRNANVRISVSKQLIQRLLPGPERTSMGVDDVIMGARTVGSSETLTQLQVRLIPSSQSWRFGLEANGNVASETSSRKGPATFYSSGNSVFRAQKEVIVNAHGVRHTPAAAAAASANDLTGLETALDPLPILGEIAQNIARKQYLSRSDAARTEMQDKIAWQASQRFDSAVDERLQEVRQQFVAQFYQPTRKLALNPAVLDMQTSQDRMVVRYRLAGFHQLAAHTPRPQAPSSSVLSVQLHESALNNLLEQIGWAGREANFRQLHQELAQLFHRPSMTLPEDFPDDVTVRFADAHPLHVAFQEGHVSLVLAFAELAQGRNRWRDFTVRVRYLPAPEQSGADLVRDEYVELSGKRLRFRDQVALRAIFSRVFLRNQPIDVLSKLLRTDRRLKGLGVTQIAIDDGWIGVAVGEIAPVQVAGKTKPVVH